MQKNINEIHFLQNYYTVHMLSSCYLYGAECNMRNIFQVGEWNNNIIWEMRKTFANMAQSNVTTALTLNAYWNQKMAGVFILSCFFKLA